MTERLTPGKTRARKRRANVPGGRQHVHRVKVTPEEEALLLQRALEAGVTIPRLLVEAALAQEGETSTQRREAQAELFHVRRLLGSLANNMNQIARAANIGEMPGDELTHTLVAVHRAAESADDLLSREAAAG